MLAQAKAWRERHTIDAQVSWSRDRSLNLDDSRTIALNPTSCLHIPIYRRASPEIYKDSHSLVYSLVHAGTGIITKSEASLTSVALLKRPLGRETTKRSLLVDCRV